jgi:hypothetical protein
MPIVRLSLGLSCLSFQCCLMPIVRLSLGLSCLSFQCCLMPASFTVHPSSAVLRMRTISHCFSPHRTFTHIHTHMYIHAYTHTHALSLSHYRMKLQPLFEECRSLSGTIESTCALAEQVSAFVFRILPHTYIHIHTHTLSLSMSLCLSCRIW